MVPASAAVPRPAASSFMPLRRVPRRPERSGWRGDLSVRTDQACGRWGWGGWRSEIKEEPKAEGRRGGHSRSHPPRRQRLAAASKPPRVYATPLTQLAMTTSTSQVQAPCAASTLIQAA